MADLETTADVALVKTKELSAHIDKAEAALAELEDKLDDAKAQFDTDWTALEEKARALLERARAHATGVAEEGEQARQALTQLDESLAQAASGWDGAVEGGITETAALVAHVAEQQPVVAGAGAEAAAATNALAERADAIEAQLQEALADMRSLLEADVVNELREAQEAIRERSAALRATLADECAAILEETFTSWQERLAQVEELIDQEFASARQHAADVVEFSIGECRRGHEEAWTELSSLVANLDGLMRTLAETVQARTGEVGGLRSAAEQALADAAAGLERMRSALAQELETMARYEFVRPL